VTTNYGVQLNVEGNGGTVSAVVNMDARMGFDDALALSFVQTLKSFPWPAGTSVNVQVSKTTDTLVSLQGHLETNPPAFL
jgi:hypothetical protein